MTTAGADASLTRALRLLDGSDPSQRTRLLAASYLSYLASVAHNKPSTRAPSTTPSTASSPPRPHSRSDENSPNRPRRPAASTVDSLRYRERSARTRNPLAELPAGHGARRRRLRATAHERRLDTTTRPRPLRHHPRELACGESPCRSRAPANQPRSGPTSTSTERRLSPPSAPAFPRHVEHAPLKSALHHADPGICGFLRDQGQVCPDCGFEDRVDSCS